MAALTRQLENLAIGKEKVEYGNVALAKKRPAGQAGQAVIVDTNIQRIDINKTTPIYKYDVSIILYFAKSDGTFAEFEVSKSPAKATQHLHDVQKCQTLYLLAVKKNANDFGKGSFFYDRQASLYSFQKLPNAGAGLTYTFKSADVPTIKDITKATITIKPVDVSFQTTSGDLLKTVNAAPKLADKTLLEALNTVINGPAVDSPNVITYGNSVHYLLDPSGAGFVPEDFLDFPEGFKYSGVGLKTAVKTLEGEAKEEAALYVVTEIKKSLFHYDNAPLMDKLLATNMFNGRMSTSQMSSVVSAIKGIQCYLDYGTNKGKGNDAQIVKVVGLGPAANSPASEFSTADGKKFTIAKYFAQKYNVNLKRPELPTIAAKGRGTMKLYLPVELLRIAESQIATTEQVTGVEQEKAIKSSAMLPADRKRQTDAVSKAMGITGSNIGGVVKVAAKSEQVPGRVLATPKMIYAGNAVAEAKNKSSWMAPRGTYLEPVSVSNWQIHVIGTNGRFDHNEYIKRLTKTMEMKGVKYSPPVITYHSQDNNLKNIFADASAKGVKYLFFIVRDNLNLHQEIKALEQQYDVLTQEVRESKAKAVIERGQNQTLENVVNKINMKWGGLNFSVVGGDGTKFTNDAGAAFIGFETTQRTTTEGPIMVGYSANVLNHPQKYAGGYYFVEKDKDVFGPIIKKVLRRVITKITATRGKRPDKLFLFFNGVSEGQWPLINEEYSKKVKEVCGEFNTENAPPYRPHIVIVAVSKMHNERLYRDKINGNGKASEQNITPGTCVDTKIVSPVVNEFYLTAQNAFQGTAKSPKFSLIFDTMGIKMDVLEQLTYQLCFLHEIVNASVSLPVPLLIADRFAKRAGMVFRKHEEKNGGRRDVYDYEKLNQELGYDGKVLDFTRYNA